MQLPKGFYEALPWIYIIIAIAGLYLSNGSTIALIFAVVLLFVAFTVTRMRHEHRLLAEHLRATTEERDRLLRERSEVAGTAAGS